MTAIKTQAELEAAKTDESLEDKTIEELDEQGALIETAMRALREREKGETRDQKKARIASLYDRGLINDRLNVPLPKDMYGEWVLADPLEVERMMGLGFVDGTPYLASRGLHDTNRIRDVTFMVTSRENKDLIEEVKAERIAARHAKPNKGKEEKDFESLTKKDTGGIVPTITESSVRDAKKSTIAEALGIMDDQTSPQGR